MIKEKTKTLATLIGVLLVSAAVPGHAQEGRPSAQPGKGAVSVEAPDVGDRQVTLALARGTVSDAFLSISEQTKLQLAISADEKDLQKTFTLMVNNQPVRETLQVITALTNLKAEIRGDVLLVQSKDAETAAAPAESASTESPREASDEAADADKDSHGFKSWKERFAEHRQFWQKRKKRVEFGRPVVVEKDEHLATAVSIGDDTTILGHIDEDAVSIGGTLTVKSGAVVERSAVAVGGRLIIEPGAVVGDDAVAVGGTVDVAEDAVVDGDRVSIGIPLPTVGGIAGAVGGILVINLLGAIARSVILFAIALLLLWLIPQRVSTVKGYLVQKPGVSLLSGFLLFLALVPLFIVLAITIVGIPLIPVAVVALFALMLLGLTAFIEWLGDRTPVFKNRRTPLKALAIGFVVFMLINIIPIFGCLFLLAAACAGVGAALQSRFGGREAA